MALVAGNQADCLVPIILADARGPLKSYRYLVSLVLFAILVACRSEATQPTPASEAEDAPQMSENSSPDALPTKETQPVPEQQSSDVEPAPVSEEAPEIKRHTFVLVGGDLHRLDRDLKTGSFVIVTGVFPKGEDGDVVIIDVPRDLYVPISCQEGVIDRIVAAYPHGIQAGGDEATGIDCVRRVVEDLFGLEVNSGVALVSGDVFEAMVDSFGGLRISPSQDHQARCGKHGIYTWITGQTYQMNGDIVKCYLKVRNTDTDRDRGRSNRARQVITAMAEQWLPLYIERPIESVANSWNLWQEKIQLSLSLREIIGLAPILPKAQSADIRSARFRVGEDVIFWTTPEGIRGLQPAVDLKEWTACTISSPQGQELPGCSELESP